MKNVIYFLVILVAFTSCEPDPKPIPEWKDISLKTDSLDIKCIQMFDENIGYIAGFPKIDSYVNNSKPFDAMVYYETLVFLIDTITPTPSKPYPSILRTEDGGLSWKPIYTPFTGISELCFADSENGFVETMREGIFKTNNGGKTWSRTVGRRYHFQNFFGSVDYDISAKSKDVYYVTCSEYDIYTTDGGENWIQFSKNLNGKLIASKEGKSIYLINDFFLMQSSDNYQSYTLLNEFQYSISDYWFVNEHNFFVLSNSKIFETLDGGASWITHFTGSYGANLEVTDDRIAYIQNPTDIYCFEIDKDTQARSMSKSCREAMFDICFPSKNIGFVVGDNGMIMKYEKP